jgi:hypothetical protein
VQQVSSAARNLTVPSADLIATGFRLPHAAAGKPPQAAIAELAPARYALVEAATIVDGDPKTLDAATRSLMRQRYGQLNGTLDTRVYIDALRKEFPVKVAEDRL